MLYNINFEKLKKICGILKLERTNRHTGYASIDRPWDKFKREILVDNIDCYEYLLKRSKFNASNIVSLCHEDVLSLDELHKKSLEYAKGFVALGIKKGDIVPIYSESSNDALIMFWALNRIGAVTTYLSASANTTEINKFINMFNAKVLVASTKTMNSNSDILDNEILKNAILISPADVYKGKEISDLTCEYLNTCREDTIENDKVIKLNQLSELGRNVLINYESSKDDDALITFTSGSTGEPKAIVLTNENIIAEIESLKKTTHMQFGKKGNALQVVPFNYPYGFIISTLLPIYVGKTVCLTPILTLKNIPDYIEMYEPTYIQAIPSFYKEIISNIRTMAMSFRFSKYQVSGGDTLDINAKKGMNKFNKEHKSRAKICDGSGLAEGGACLTTAVILGKPNYYSVGKPIVGLNVKIVDPETLEELEYGKVGKFCFSGKNLMKGYYNDKEATDKVIYTDSNGIRWFVSDTYAHMDEKGYLYIDGRDRRFFITYDETGSPYKVYSDYVQSIVTEHKDVLDAAVVKKQDDIRSYIPKAFVVLKDNVKLEDVLNEIINLCKNKLQNCAIPVEFEVIDSIPLTNAMKVNYQYLEQKCALEYKNMVNKTKIYG